MAGTALRGRLTWQLAELVKARGRQIGHRATDGDDPDRAAAGDDTETRLLYSSRSQGDVIYRDELERLRGNGLTVVHALTDSQPPGWTRYARRVDAEMLAEVSPSPAERPRFYAWTDAVRRGGGRIARPARTRHAGDQDRTLWTHRTVTWAS